MKKSNTKSTDSNTLPIAYRGYMIVPYSLDGSSLGIQKSDQHIAYCASVEDGKRIIDQLAA